MSLFLKIIFCKNVIREQVAYTAHITPWEHRNITNLTLQW